MKNNNLLRQLLIDEEGCDLEAYKDSEDIWTIGIGHNLEIDQSPEELAILGLEDELDDWEGFTITEQQAFELFDLDVEEAGNDLYPAFADEDLAKLNDTRYAVLVSMVFQMGGAGVRKFKNFVQAVKTEDWDTAAEEMIYANPRVKRHSKWYLQTPERCQRAADAMRTGSFEKDEEASSIDEEFDEFADRSDFEAEIISVVKKHRDSFDTDIVVVVVPKT